MSKRVLPKSINIGLTTQKVSLTMRFVLPKAMQRHIILMAPVHHIVQGANVDPLRRNALVLASSNTSQKMFQASPFVFLQTP